MADALIKYGLVFISGAIVAVIVKGIIYWFKKPHNPPLTEVRPPNPPPTEVIPLNPQTTEVGPPNPPPTRVIPLNPEVRPPNSPTSGQVPILPNEATTVPLDEREFIKFLLTDNKNLREQNSELKQQVKDLMKTNSELKEQIEELIQSHHDDIITMKKEFAEFKAELKAQFKRPIKIIFKTRPPSQMDRVVILDTDETKNDLFLKIEKEFGRSPVSNLRNMKTSKEVNSDEDVKKISVSEEYEVFFGQSNA